MLHEGSDGAPGEGMPALAADRDTIRAAISIHNGDSALGVIKEVLGPSRLQTDDVMRSIVLAVLA